MGSNLGIRTETFAPPEDQSWLGSQAGTDNCESITLDGAAFAAAGYDGYIPSGTVLAKSGTKYVPYGGGGSTAEVATITSDRTGGTFTVTVDGETTGAISVTATAAVVAAAVRDLSTVEDVTGTGGPVGTADVVLTFARNDHDVSVTDSGTGGTGLSVAVTGGGGAASTDQATGLLFTTVGFDLVAAADVTAAQFWGPGRVIRANLPGDAPTPGASHVGSLDGDAEAALSLIRFV